MTLYAVSIEKQTTFHGKNEEFSNVYFYEGPAFQAGDENYKRLCDRLVAAEKLVHGNEVTFLRARIWSSGASALENVTLGLFDYTGAGTLAVTELIHAEEDVLVEWECARSNILGRKVYLRKYLRPQGLPVGSNASMGRGKLALASGVMTPFKTYADTVQAPSDATMPQFSLVSPTGRTPRAAANGVIDPLIRTREFRRN